MGGVGASLYTLPVSKQQINNMSIQIDWTDDVRYDEFVAIGRQEGIQEGLQKGELKNLTANVLHILQSQRFTVEEIAELLHISTDFVRAVQTSMKKP